MPAPAPPGGPLVDLAIIAAAGGSTRMGSPKALLLVDGRPLIAHHVERLGAVARRVVVVVGAEAGRVAAAVPAGALVVVNDGWASSDMWTSLSLGARAAPGDRALVTPVDVPPVGAWIAAFAAGLGAAVPRTPSGRDGHPVRLDAAALGRLRGGGGGTLRALVADARRIDVADEWLAEDFDTPEAWSRWREP